MNSPSTERFTGLYATPELVGRQSTLEKFERILNDPSPTPKLVFLFGLGGIGKTRLIKKALDLAQKNLQYRVAEGVIDFYHIALHTPIGLANAIFEILTPPFDCFQTYLPAFQALNRARLSGNVVELEKLREDAVSKFDQDLKRLSAASRVVLALDTAERVVYGLPDISDEIPLAEAWNWLVDCLPAWGNITVFIAGREEARPAIERMKVQTSVVIEEVEIGAFSLDESVEYFDSVAHLAQERKDYHLAERLKNMPLDFKNGAHAYSLGRPILLSLFVDYLSFPGESEVPVILHQTLPADPKPEDSRRYEGVLFDRLRQGELGETLIALGRAPKGVDDELLAALLGVSSAEARKRLSDVQCLSVVKIRPEDQRVFIHDEMYDLLQRNVYDSPYDAESQKIAFEAIKNYYQAQRDRITQQLNELYAPVEEQGRESLDMKELSQVHTRYQALLTEIMYYFLRHDLGRGFRAYYRYSHEAIMARDLQMDLQLQAELLSYLSRPPAPILEQDITIEMILANLKMRPLAHAWAHNQHEAGLKEAHRFIDTIEQKWRTRFPVLLAIAHIWTASLHIMRGTKEDQIEAEEHLALTYPLLSEKEVLAPFAEPSYPDTILWHRKATFALAHRVNAYLRRVQGLMRDAVAEYQKAAIVLREIDLRIEMATTMNDMGFAQAELGEWHDGRGNVMDALRLRRELGQRVPVALSLNTLAAIDVREGWYGSARENSEHALSLFRAFSHNRGIGMALVTLAEAMRRYAGSTPLLSVDERIELLRRARDHAREANSLFSEAGEAPRQVEALIEIGAACRDWVWRLVSSPRPGDDTKRISRESADALRQAADLAQKHGLTYRHVDALVNLAWLEFYLLQDKEDLSDEYPLSISIRKAEAAFPADAEIEKQPQVWVQKSKLSALKGHLAYHQFIKQRQGEPKGISDELKSVLGQVAENYARSLDYSTRFAPDYQGIRQAKDGMFDRLRRLNAAEMRLICGKIQLLYPEGSVIQTFLTNRALWQTG